MSKISLPFSRAEYQARLLKTRQAMAAKNIDVLFVEDPSNMAWLTGYDGWSFYVHQGVLISMDAPPVWWGRAQDASGAKFTVYMADNSVFSYGDDYVQATDKHPMQDLANLLKAKGYEKKRIGLELDNYYFSAKAYLTLKESLKNATFVDATALVNWQRMVKSTQEIAYMKKAASISQYVVENVIKRIEPGLKKNQLIASIYQDLINGKADAWGDYPAIVPLMPSGVFAAAPHLTWDNQVFKKAEATFLELSGCYRRYHAPLCRTVFLGKATATFLNAEAALVEGLAMGIEVARAGARACDVANALYTALNKHGIKRQGRCGYPVGLSYPPDWGERTASLRVSDETVLQAGMTFHFMPGLWMDTWGMEITETILINETGPATCFADMPRCLFVKN